MADYMDVDMAGCYLQFDTHPSQTAYFYAGSVTALDAETTYPWVQGGIASLNSVQLASPPLVGMLVKLKDVDSYQGPVVELQADGGNGNLVAGVIMSLGSSVPIADGYFECAVYFFQPGDILKLKSTTGQTNCELGDAISFYTSVRTWIGDNTNGFGKVIKAAAAAGDDFKLMVTQIGGLQN